MNNLVSNAIKHTNEGTVTIAITELSHTDSDTTLHFSVKDTGAGIPEDIMAKTRLKLAKMNILDILNKPFRPGDLVTSLSKVNEP